MASWVRIYNNTSYSIHKQLEEMARLQEIAASGSMVLRASDSPSDAQRIMQLHSATADWARYGKNLSNVQTTLQAASTALDETAETLGRVKQVVTQAATGTYGPEIQASIAEEIDSLLEQAVSLANHRNLGQYVFAGEDPSVKPYTVQHEGGRIVSVSYRGAERELQVPVAPGVTQSGLLVGDKVFRMHDRGDIAINGPSGAAIGSGTSSVRGHVSLEISHTSSDYADGAASGVTPAASSAHGDTILGEHTITISGGTIRLDNGPAVAMTGQANLKLTNGDGDAAYVDVSSYAAGWEGQFTVSASGTVSVNGGTAEAIDFSDANQRFTAPDGRALFLDSTGIERIGSEHVSVAGTHDLFETLIHVRQVLQSGATLSDTERSELLAGALDSLDEVSRNVSQSLTVVGGRIQALDRLEGTMATLTAAADTEIASIESADLAQVAVELSKTQTLYQATLAAAGRILSLNLLDFLR